MPDGNSTSAEMAGPKGSTQAVAIVSFLALVGMAMAIYLLHTRFHPPNLRKL
jgi:hypothetical protein